MLPRVITLCRLAALRLKGLTGLLVEFMLG